MTIEELNELRSTPIMRLQREDLSDTAEIEADLSGHLQQRLESYLKGTGNPYALNAGKYILQTGYMEGVEDTLDDRMVLLARKHAGINI